MVKAQLKIQQMAFMLMAITLFFVLVGMFALVFKTSNLRQSAEVLEEKNALLLVTRLANSPEFSCGNSFGTNRINCVDADKVMALRSNLELYKNFWGISNIEIMKLDTEETSDCTIGNYPNCQKIKLIEGEIASEYSNFVSLCRKASFEGKPYDSCEIAKLMVGYNE